MNYPVLSMKPDGGSFQVELDNPAAESGNNETDGEYDITRPVYTRTPPRTWTFMYSHLNQADHDALETFWNSVKGSSVAFNWTHPKSGEVVNVRFVKGFKLQLVRKEFVGDFYKTNQIGIKEV